MDVIYMSSEKHDRNDKYMQSVTSSANQLDVLLQDLVNERNLTTREKDIFLPSEKYTTVDSFEYEMKGTGILNLHQAYEQKSADKSFQSEQYTHNSKMSSEKDIYGTNSIDDKFLPSLIRKEDSQINFSESILPKPGTKVTTTVRTFTYEVPITENNISLLSNKSSKSVETEDLKGINRPNISLEFSHSKDYVAGRNETLKSMEAVFDKENTIQDFKNVDGTVVQSYSKKENFTPPHDKKWLMELQEQKGSSWKYTYKPNSFNTSHGPSNYKPHGQNINTLYSEVTPVPLNVFESNKFVRSLHDESNSKTAVGTQNSSVEKPSPPMISNINKMGSAVYYPPTQISKKEERGANYSMKGNYEKSSQMYEHEYGYKSKTKSSSRGTVIPVCLPLCCAMPCSIM